MNSFDVFDTLLARRYFTSDPIWHHLANEFNLPNFVQQRKGADASGRSYEQIYDYLVATNAITDQQRNAIATRELELEIETSFPIQKNIDRVEDGDILISDMYLHGSAILQFVRSIGLTKQVTIYQSGGDKSTGDIWRRMQHFKPDTHLGDHTNSDVGQARANGINGELYAGTHFNAYEQDLFNDNLKNIATLAREVRLRSSSANNELFSDLSASLNLPLLFIGSELLYRKYQGRPIVFLGRDCQLLHKIYTEYFELSYYTPFSRKVAYDNPALALAYLVKHSAPGAVLVDISSTGGTWQKLDPIDIEVLIYSDQSYYTPIKPTLPETFSYITTNTEIGQTNLLLEVFNCGDHGHLNSLTQITDGMFHANFGTPELDKEIVNAIHRPIYNAVALSSIYKEAVREELSRLSTERLIEFLRYCTSSLCVRTDLYALLGNFVNQETTYLDQFTNE